MPHLLLILTSTKAAFVNLPLAVKRGEGNSVLRLIWLFLQGLLFLRYWHRRQTLIQWWNRSLSQYILFIYSAVAREVNLPIVIFQLVLVMIVVCLTWQRSTTYH